MRAAALAERGAPPDTAPLPEPDAGAAEAAAIAPETGPEARPPVSEPADDAVVELPSLEALTPETDLVPFLRAGVPAALRNAALRRMWSLDPAIRDFVQREAREYAYDWNTPGGVPGLGPLLPSDDVQAMLGRLLGGAAQAAPEGVETRDREAEGSPGPGQTPDHPDAADPSSPRARPAGTLAGPAHPRGHGVVPATRSGLTRSDTRARCRAGRRLERGRVQDQGQDRACGVTAARCPIRVRSFGLRAIRAFLIVIPESGIGPISSE
ncbi:DUF3306 domain-containing protein (plasmid) [Methylobacterium oryzae CBMB20]